VGSHLRNNLDYLWVISSNNLENTHFRGLCFLTSCFLWCFILCYKSRQQRNNNTNDKALSIKYLSSGQEEASLMHTEGHTNNYGPKGRLWMFYNRGVYIGSRHSSSASQPLTITSTPNPPHPPLMGRHKHRSMIV